MKKGGFYTGSNIRYIFVSLTLGAVTAVLIFLFKLAANAVISLSSDIYSFVRENPSYFPILVLGVAIIGALSALLLGYSPNCRGGGIPTALAALRGFITFSWVKNIFLLFFSSMLTYIGGIPLGNEGPSVQMGTALGKGCVRVLAPDHPAWDRYMMTGGACAGFAAATGAPLAGMFFAFEEAHRRFSSVIFIISSITVIASSVTMNVLCYATGTSGALFDFSIGSVLPTEDLWMAAIVGIACGLCAIAFTNAYTGVRAFLQNKLSKIHRGVKVVLIFVLVAVFGFVSSELIGSGHGIVEELIDGYGVWYLLILYFCVRAFLLVLANNIGITGGLFVPTLAFGAIIGALFAKLFCSVSLLSTECYAIIVIIGIASVLGSFSRIPLTAIIFSVEALGGASNMLAIIIGVSIAYLVVELFCRNSFTDVVVEGRVEDAHRGKKLIVVDTNLTVKEGSFVIGKEIRDILFPPSCVILSIHKCEMHDVKNITGLVQGDTLRVHYQTYDPQQTLKDLEDLVGCQDKLHPYIHGGDEHDTVPEL